jgi:succinyl-diaminopimelate desuccinylase
MRIVCNPRWRRIVLAPALVAMASGSSHAAVDFLALREQLEVQRPALRAGMQDWIRPPGNPAFGADKPGVAFARYLDLVWKTLDARRNFPEVQAAMTRFRGSLDAADATQREALGVLLGDYLQVRYGEDFVRELSTAVGFKTFHTVVDRNSTNPEFQRAFAHLTELATSLGLEAKNEEGEQLTISLPAAGGAARQAPIAVYTHVDVARPVEHKWKSKPWSLAKADDRWVGCGVSEGKGPLILNLFALRVLRDANLKLARPIVLLADANGQQLDAEVGTCAARLPVRPAWTLAAAGEFPYATGQLGHAVARIASRRGMKSRAALQPGEFYIHKLGCWFGTNTVPSEGRVWVRYEAPKNSNNPSLDMTNKWRAIIEAYQPEHPESVYENYIQDDTLHYFVYGQPAALANAAHGVNSLEDIAGSLMRVPLMQNSARDVVQWIAEGLRRDRTGASIGLDASHPEMGTPRVSPIGFDRLGDEVAVLVDIRWPVGHDRTWVKQRLEASLAEFNAKHKMQLAVSWESAGYEPSTYAVPSSVGDLLADAFALASGESMPPAAVTAMAARMGPGVVPFGPHGPRVPSQANTRDESLSKRELQDMGVAYLSALAWLATAPVLPTP